METFSASLALYAGNSPVTGEFPAQRPVTRNFDVFFDLGLNKRLSKQPWGWWFETPSRPLWRRSNEKSATYIQTKISPVVITGLSSNKHVMSTRRLETNFGEISIKIQTCSFKKMHLKMSSAQAAIFQTSIYHPKSTFKKSISWKHLPLYGVFQSGPSTGVIIFVWKVNIK